jgi:hypothetical protein
MSKRSNRETAVSGHITRRRFPEASAAVLATSGLRASSRSVAAEPVAAKVIVGAHPWVYAATQPKYDVTPILPRIFADMRYAGLQGIELMHTALRSPDAVERIGELSQRHELPVIGASFGGPMWDRAQHQAVLEDAELVITRLKKLGGRTLGTSVGQAPQRKTPEQLDAAVIELAHERDFPPTRPVRESLKISRAFVREVLGYRRPL